MGDQIKQYTFLLFILRCKTNGLIISYPQTDTLVTYLKYYYYINEDYSFFSLLSLLSPPLLLSPLLLSSPPPSPAPPSPLSPLLLSLSSPLFLSVYLEYDAVGRLGISDPHKYIKQRFKSHDLLMLNSCCLATRVINEVDGCVQEEVRRTEKWVDILVNVYYCLLLLLLLIVNYDCCFIVIVVNCYIVIL